LQRSSYKSLPVILEFQLWIHWIIDRKGSIHDEPIEMPLAFRDHVRQRPETGGLIFEYGGLERNRFVEGGKCADDRDAGRRSAIRACVDKSNFVVIVELRRIVYRVRAATIGIDDGKAS
jgi:hypothetical protein